MSDPLAIAQNAIPKLHSLINDLIRFSEQIGQSGIEIKNPAKDPLARPGAMAIAYASKQTEHLRSVRVLVSAGQHRDANLIARTMIEGLAQLTWAFDNLPGGPEKWFRYGFIEDWRELDKQRNQGKPVDPEISEIAQKQLDAYGADYIDSRKKGTAGSPPADPYRNQWSDLSAWKMFSQIDAGSELYNSVYRDASAWVHWSPRSMYLAISDVGDRNRYELNDPQRAATALAAGAMSLLLTLRLLNKVFALGHQHELIRLDWRLAEITATLPEEE